MKKNYIFLPILLFSCIFFLSLPAKIQAQTATAPLVGDGSAGNPYQIETLENLYWISVNASTQNYKYFIQTADIDASSTSGWTNGWIPIGCYGGGNIAFYGSYNGQGHVISNLYSTSGSSNTNWGLFGVFSSGAIISNLGLTNVNITSVLVSGGTGALAGRTTGCSITNCYSTGSVTAKGMAGGLVGDLENSTVTGCFSSCTATITGTSDNYVGGFAGRIVSNAIVTKCYATGSTFSKYGYQGGFVGSTETTPIITDCYATGNSSSTNPYLVGGFVGFISGGNVSNCYSTGTVPAGGSWIGGFSGYGAAVNSFWDTETSGKATSFGGATGKTTAQMKTQSTFSDASWDFAATWGMNTIINNGYPYLQSFYTLWTGTTSSDWNTTTNWSSGSVPTALVANLYIPDVTNDPVVNRDPGTPAVCSNIIIASGASLTIAAGKALTVFGTLTNNAGTSGLVVNSGGSLIERTTGVSATVNSDIPAGQWHLISVPVTNATSNVFLGHYLQTHSESTNAYTDITPTTDVLTPMKGYALYGEGGFTTTYTGTLNTGNQSYSTAYSGSSNGWNLVGNPYSSSIDWNGALGWTKTNVNNSTYIHKDAANWATFNGATGLGTNSGTQYIAPGQGFFVQASAAGTLAMTDAVKVHNATTFFKNAEATVPNLLRLQVSGNGYSDEAVVHFAPEATAEFDGSYDAHKLYGDVPEAAQVYTLGSIPLAINSLPATSTVPMGIYTGAAGTYTLAATEINDLTGVTLEDTHTGIFTDLTKSPCSVELAAGESGQRFILHFGLLSIEEKESSPASIYSYRHTAYIHMNENTSGDIFIYSISGQLVATIPSASGIKEVQLPVSGTYIVKVVAEKATEVRKIFIN